MLRKRKWLSKEASLVMVEARKRAKELSPSREDIAIFVTRRSPGLNSFLWQIRRFGGVVLQTSEVGYPTLEAARDAGATAHVSHVKSPNAKSASSICR